MAGGEGSRLRPLTCTRPKPLVPLCNKPVLEHTVELLKRHGVDKIMVTLHYLADEIVSYCGDGSSWGIPVSYSVEDEPLGTAGSIKLLESAFDEAFFIVSGDCLTDFDLTGALNFHHDKGAMATIVLARVENPLEFGVVITDDDQRIVEFVEKPSWGEVFSDTVNTGIYIVDPEVFDYIEEGTPCDFSKDLFPRLMEAGCPLYGYVASGYWSDIGSLQMYRQAHQDLFDGRVHASIPGKRLARDVWLGEGTEIHPSVLIRGPVVIGRNCRLKEGVEIGEMTAIGDNCLIEEGVFIQRSILWNNVFVGRKSRITGSTVCRRVAIKGGAQLSEGVILGDDCFVDSGAVVHPQVKVWPGKTIEAGANVNMSIIWGVRWPGSLFGHQGISGLANIEITPEFALKLGAAYGAFLEKGATVTTSRDAHPASRMFNRAIICGLISVGCNVYDLRVCPAPVARYTIRNAELRGGIHTRISPGDARSALIEFFDPRGINASKTTERRIENLFFREDFRRTSLDEVGVIEFPSRAVEEYSEGFLRAIDPEVVRQANFKVVIDYVFGNASGVLPGLLGRLGCESVAINAYLDSAKGRTAYEDRARGLNQLSNIVTALGANLGVLMDLDAESMVVIDDQGEIISDMRLLVLMVLLVLRSVNNAIVVAPVSAPSVLEKLAAEHRGKIIRTRTDGRSLMQTAQLGESRIHLGGGENGAFLFPHFLPSFDAMFAFTRLLELVAREKQPLSELDRLIPPFFMSEACVDCAPGQKGRVMRGLAEEYRDRPVDHVEGVKISFEQGWVLVVPDPTLPHLRVVVEGGCEEDAQALLTRVTSFIRGLTASPVIDADSEPPRRARSGGARAALDRLVLPEEKAFHFWAPDRYLGVQARSFRDFVDTVLYIDVDSLDFHMDRGDFVNWFECELGNKPLAQKLRILRDRGLRGEEMRVELLKLIR